jgi:hypothetical protein
MLASLAIKFSERVLYYIAPPHRKHIKAQDDDSQQEEPSPAAFTFGISHNCCSGYQ